MLGEEIEGGTNELLQGKSVLHNARCGTPPYPGIATTKPLRNKYQMEIH